MLHSRVIGLTRGDSELSTYLAIAVILTIAGAALLIIGFVFMHHPTLAFEMDVARITGVVLLIFGIPLLLAGLSRLSDERRKRAQEARYRRRSRGRR